MKFIEILEKSEMTESYSTGYSKYIFPIQAKEIESGSVIIEKNGKKIEVPFEYKYLKFWY